MAGLLMLVGLIGTLNVTGCMERQFYHPRREPTPPPTEVGAERVWFNSADGTRLQGWFIPAQGDTRAPTILHVHGNAGSMNGHVWFTEHLPPAGFNVFLFDYRGFGESEGNARRREPLIADAHAALDTLLALDNVDPTRVGMWAQSLGGAVGLNLMAERPEIRTAIVEAAFTSWREIAAAAVGGDPPGLVSRILAAVLIKDHLRPIDAIALIDRPILIIHGTADRTIPISHGRRLAAAAPQGELVESPDRDHNDLRSPEMDRLTTEYLGTQLAGNDPDPAHPPAQAARSIQPGAR